MKWFAETTVWTDAAVNNGIYLLDDSKSKMYAFRSFGTGNIKVFQNPIRIDVRGRKFVANVEQFVVNTPDEMSTGHVTQVKGSKGNIYQVTELDGVRSCTCSGFKFRSNCAHIKGIAI